MTTMFIGATVGTLRVEAGPVPYGAHVLWAVTCTTCGAHYGTTEAGLIRGDGCKQHKEAPSRPRFLLARVAIRRRAGGAVLRALKHGNLTRPAACERCGEQTTLNGHHPDYTRLTHVEWLCPTCHAQRHREVDGTDLDPYRHIDLDAEEAAEAARPVGSKGPVSSHCSLCGKPHHNRRTCPQREGRAA
jgi:hypothetical protein